MSLSQEIGVLQLNKSKCYVILVNPQIFQKSAILTAEAWEMGEIRLGVNLWRDTITSSVLAGHYESAH